MGKSEGGSNSDKGNTSSLGGREDGRSVSQLGDQGSGTGDGGTGGGDGVGYASPEGRIWIPGTKSDDGRVRGS